MVIADYAATSGAMRDAVPSINRSQPGDPVKGAAAILRIADLEEPSVRVRLGGDSVAELDLKVERSRSESVAFRELALSTDHDDVVIS